MGIGAKPRYAYFQLQKERDVTFRRDDDAKKIPVLSAGSVGLESGGVPLRFIAQVSAFTAGAVLLVHLFLNAGLTLAKLAAHAAALSILYTLAFSAAYIVVGAVWPRIRVWRLPASAFIWAVCILAAGLGVAISRGLQIYFAPFEETVNAHQEVNFIPRLIPIWAIIVILLIRNEKQRLLSRELNQNPLLKGGAQDHPDNEALSDSANAIRLKSGRSQFTLDLKFIAYIAAEENYCAIHFCGPERRVPLIVRSTFARLIDQLPSELFVQIHRSYAVNRCCVANIDASANVRAVTLNDGSKLPISRARLAETRMKFSETLTTV